MKGQANAYSHTHCQTAQANPQNQVWQRVCLSNRTTKMVLKNFPTLQKNKKRHAQPDRQMIGNLTMTMVYRHGGQERQQLTGVWRQWRVTWLTEHSTSHQLCGVLTVLCSEIRHCAKRQNVSCNAFTYIYNKI